MEYALYFKPLLQMLGVYCGCHWTVFAGLMLQESGGDPNAVGDGGRAYGLCQIHAATKNNHAFSRTWEMEKLKDPVANVAVLIAEMRRLREWLDDWWGDSVSNSDWLLLCWNWGAGNVRSHIEAGKGLYDLPPDVATHLRLYHEKAQSFIEEGGDENA